MNWKTIAVGGAVAAGAYFLVNYFAGGIKYTFSHVKWLGLDGLKMRFALVYTLINENDIPASVTSLKAKFMYGDHKLTDVDVTEPITVPPMGGSEDVEIRFSVSPGALLAEILQFIESGGGFKKFRLRGWMGGKIGPVPFKVPINEYLELAEG